MLFDNKINKENECFYVVYLIKGEDNPTDEVNIFKYNTYIHGNYESIFVYKTKESICADTIHLNRYDSNVNYKCCIKTLEEAEKVKLQFENKILKEKVNSLEEGVRNLESSLHSLKNKEMIQLKTLTDTINRHNKDKEEIKKLMQQLLNKNFYKNKSNK